MAYLARDGTVDITALGGYGVIGALSLFIIVVGSYGGAFYLYISKKSGKLFQELYETQVIKDEQFLEHIVMQLPASIQAKHNQRRWTVLALTITILIMATSIYLVQWPPLGDDTFKELTKYRALGAFVLVPPGAFGVYLIVMLTIRPMLTRAGLKRVFDGRDVGIQPLHPDRCGGLRVLLDYALSLSYMIAVFGFGIVLFAYINSQAIDDCVAGIGDKTDSEVLSDVRCVKQLEQVGVSSGPHHQDSGEAKIRESTAGVSRKPSSDCKACGCSSKHLCGLTAWNT